MHRLPRVAAGLIALWLTAPGVATAHGASATPPGACAALKLGAIAEAVRAVAACKADAARHGVGTDPACLAAAADALETGFARAEARATCEAPSDASVALAAIDALVTELAAGFGSGAPCDFCEAERLQAAARLATQNLRCERRAERTGTDLDSACVGRAQLLFERFYRKTARRLPCAGSLDVGETLALVDVFVGRMVALVTAGIVPGRPAPAGLDARVVGGEVVLDWIPPDPFTGSTHVLLLRRLDAEPAGPEDAAASEIYFGTGDTAAHAFFDLVPSTIAAPTTYHYAAYGCTATRECETLGSRTSLVASLVDMLRLGGFTIHWRHASATVCADQIQLGTAATTSVPGWWRSCDAQCPPAGGATARQLNAAGFSEATSIGADFDLLEIAVSRVLTSEFCRNVTTAQLMDFGPPIEERQEITFFVYDEADRCAASYALLAEPPAPGTNTALIGHAGFDCPILGGLGWAEAAVFRPDGLGGAAFVGRVLWNEWLALP